MFIWKKWKRASEKRDQERNGKLIGQVDPTKNALSRRMRLRSFERNQVINAQMEAITA